ncbi:MAG: S41 family peptidase [Rhodospirillaceae bacterium]|jgi:carboxyl-terminal processing protease|nr:S41 family peptidase [Rhodospirillaceae bacterium]MBT5373981.1 S41 family peptidase [Rhodospirillaceae bacterium]MBT5660402.1 S41 family peptidase [Rhodospirillaceae bacterium]MBT5752082.1 S41 family peptidase [Rhodospirillaceae bacterium]
MHRYGLALITGVALLVLPDVLPAEENASETYRQLNLFGEVFERVRADYVEEVPDSDLIESAINGMLTSLDPHSSFLNTKSFQDMRVQTKGEFGGLGIEVTMEGGLVKVVSPIDDTPAYRAGIKSGDLITRLNGKPILGMSLNEAVGEMRGPVGSDIKLTIRRNGEEPFDVSITRAVIHIKSVRSRVIGDIGYFRVTTFNEQADSGLKKAVKKIKAELGDNLKGVVLDLRNNPGGLLDQAVSISDEFLNQGEIVSTRGRHPDDAQRYNAKPGDLAEGLPMVVLINGGSASASEIVAGALQDHHRAIIMGTQSFGKGSVQTIIPMGNMGAIRLTTARYYTPSGRSIQGEGIEPGIVVEEARIEPLDVSGRRREADLPGALENEHAAPATPLPDEETPEEKIARAAEADYQLVRAVDLLRGIVLFEGRAKNQ